MDARTILDAEIIEDDRMPGIKDVFEVLSIGSFDCQESYRIVGEDVTNFIDLLKINPALAFRQFVFSKKTWNMIVLKDYHTRPALVRKIAEAIHQLPYQFELGFDFSHFDYDEDIREKGFVLINIHIILNLLLTCNKLGVVNIRFRDNWHTTQAIISLLAAALETGRFPANVSIDFSFSKINFADFVLLMEAVASSDHHKNLHINFGECDFDFPVVEECIKQLKLHQFPPGLNIDLPIYMLGQRGISLYSTEIDKQFCDFLTAGRCPDGYHLNMHKMQDPEAGALIADAMESGKTRPFLTLRLDRNSFTLATINRIISAAGSGQCREGLKLFLNISINDVLMHSYGDRLTEIFQTAFSEGKFPNHFYLDLSDNNLGIDANFIEKVLPIIIKNETLKNFVLNFYDNTEQSSTEICKLLKSKKVASGFTLNGSSFQDGTKIVKVITSGKCMNDFSLGLHKSSITDHDLRCIALAIKKKKYPTGVRLDLTNNHDITDEGVLALANAITESSCPPDTKFIITSKSMTHNAQLAMNKILDAHNCPAGFEFQGTDNSDFDIINKQQNRQVLRKLAINAVIVQQGRHQSQSLLSRLPQDLMSMIHVLSFSQLLPFNTRKLNLNKIIQYGNRNPDYFPEKKIDRPAWKILGLFNKKSESKKKDGGQEQNSRKRPPK